MRVTIEGTTVTIDSMKEAIDNFYRIEPIDINQIACNKLEELLKRCTINLVAELAGITRKTLYRWLNSDVTLEEMDHKQAAWFILVCETSPKLQLLLTRPPLSHPRMAKRLTDEV